MANVQRYHPFHEAELTEALVHAQVLEDEFI